MTLSFVTKKKNQKNPMVAAIGISLAATIELPLMMRIFFLKKINNKSIAATLAIISGGDFEVAANDMIYIFLKKDQ
jgi:hypothetical protein